METTYLPRKKCGSINDGYAIIGMRPERLTLDNGKYVYKKETKSTQIDKLKETAFHIVNHLQLSMNHINFFVKKRHYEQHCEQSHTGVNWTSSNGLFDWFKLPFTLSYGC